MKVILTEITKQPNDSTVIALEDVILQCSASVDGAAYSWHRINGDLPHRAQGENSHKLTIGRAIPSDQGMYYCMASKEKIRIKSKAAILNVNGKGIFVADGSRFLFKIT